MKALRWASMAGLLALLVVLLAAAAPAWAQTTVPSPTPSPADTSSTCQSGQLCVQNGPLAGAGGSGGGQVFVGRDPPAHFVRSFATMAVVAFILGSFLVLAVTGRRLPFPRRRPRQRS